MKLLWQLAKLRFTGGFSGSGDRVGREGSLPSLARLGFGIPGASRGAGVRSNRVIMDPEISEHGPAMRALTEQQRRYVLAQLADPFGNATRWAKAAGYSDTAGGAKVRAHANAHNPKIEAAVHEVARQYLNANGPLLGIAVAMKIARNPKHPKQLRAAEMLLNRVGMHEMTEHKVTVDHRDQTGAAMVERIKQVAAALGLDVATLLGANAAPADMKLIEGTVEKAG